MLQLLPSQSLLPPFLLASVVLAVSPGPGVLYIVTRTMVQGRRYGLISVAGMVLGNACNVVAASVGLAAVFAVSSMAFAVVKYVGAAYLVYLGVRLLIKQSNAEGEPARADPSPRLTEGSTQRVFRDGLLVALFNPKTTLFFAAFLPQFVDGRTSAYTPVYQSITLGMIFVAIAAVTDGIYALVAASIAPTLGRHIVSGQRAGGIVFIGLGVLAALASVNPAK